MLTLPFHTVGIIEYSSLNVVKINYIFARIKRNKVEKLNTQRISDTQKSVMEVVLVHFMCVAYHLLSTIPQSIHCNYLCLFTTVSVYARSKPF